jgi:NADH-quinone oxidoreductase subunit J
MAVITDIVFLLAAVAAVVGALWVVLSRRPMRCALGLMITLVSLAGIYAMMHAHLVAIIQILVYAGGIVVLFGFVIMLLKQGEPLRYRGPFLPVWIVSLLTVCYLAYMILPVVREVKRVRGAVPEGFGTIEFMGEVLTSAHLIPFEMIAILLLMTLVGVIALARRQRKEVTP